MASIGALCTGLARGVTVAWAAPQPVTMHTEVTMTLVGALLGILGVAAFARWLLIGGDNRKHGKR